MTTLIAPPAAVADLAARVCEAGADVAVARRLVDGCVERILASGGGESAAAARAATAEAGRRLDELHEALRRLAKALGAADALQQAVERRLADALIPAPRQAPHPGLGRATAAGLGRLADLGATLGLEAAVALAPPSLGLLADVAGRAIPEGPGDAVLVPGAAGATDLAGWARRLDAVAATPGTIALTELANGAWVVQLPGIHSMLPTPDPQDLPGAAAALTTGRCAYLGAVVVALQRAGVPPGAPLLLVGHSQGGIVAADLAADPAVRARWRVTHVLAAGSPVSRTAVPVGTALLEVSNRADLVPGLDLAPGRDGPGRTAVAFTRERGDVGRNHDLGTTYAPYLASPAFTADPRVRAWRLTASPYLAGGPARTLVFAIRDRPQTGRATAP